MLITNHWYVAAASAKLGEAPLPTRIGNEALVLFRDRDGRAQALRDRCCHRGLPLSRGRVVAGRLTCGFHGWSYDGEGHCRGIPSQPQKAVPPSYCVPSYPCAERDGYVFVWTGSGEPTAVPAIEGFSDSNWIQGRRDVRCHALRALEISFDIAHVYFVHPSHPATVAAASQGFAPRASELRLTANGCELLHPMPEEGKPILSSMAFSLPGEIRFRWTQGGMPGSLIFFIVPIGKQECRIEWIATNPTAAPGAARLFYSEGPSTIMDEDAAILEAIQATYLAEGEAFECSVEADAPALWLRKIYQAAERGEWRGLASDWPRKRLVHGIGPKDWERLSI